MPKAIRRPRFGLTDLRLFVSVAEAGSLTGGAQHVGLALSAASARLKSLEEKLGSQLFERRSTGVAATQAGALFLDYARRVTKAADEAQSIMDVLHQDGAITLKFLTNHMGLSTNLPAQLGQFMRKYPMVDINLEQLPSKLAVPAIESGEADIGVIDVSAMSSTLMMIPYRRDRLVFAVANDHPLAAQRKWSFAEVLNFPLIGMESSSSLQVFVEQMALLAHLPAHFRARAPTFPSAAQLVSEGVGVAFMPEPPARRYEQLYPITVRELSDSWAVRELQICLRPSLDSSAPAHRLAAFLTGQAPAEKGHAATAHQG